MRIPGFGVSNEFLNSKQIDNRQQQCQTNLMPMDLRRVILRQNRSVSDNNKLLCHAKSIVITYRKKKELMKTNTDKMANVHCDDVIPSAIL